MAAAQIDDFDARELRRMRRKLDTLSGEGVVNTPDSISIKHRNKPTASLPGGGDPPVLVKIASNAAGGGWYNATVVDGTVSGDGTANLSLPEGMTEGDTVLVFNTPENGSSSHSLGTDTYHIGKLASNANGDSVVILDTIGLGTQQYQVYSMTSASAAGWDWVRAHS